MVEQDKRREQEQLARALVQAKERARREKQAKADRQDLSVLDWIEHAQQELQDGILYLEKLKQTLKGK